MNQHKVETLVHELLLEIGEDPQREGLVKTPQRVAAALQFLTSGYRTDAAKLVNGAIFTQRTNSMVIVKNIEVYSLCEHHMLPFYGRCHIGYIPNGRVFGVSKLARVVDMYARRLQLQERLTEQISQEVMDSVDADRRRRHDRGAAPVHDDARRGKAELGDGHLLGAGNLSRIGRDAGGVPDADRQPAHLGRHALAHRPPAGGDAP